jgi:hypothetical protein
MHKEQNLQKIIAMHSESSKDGQFFGKNVNSFSEKRQGHKILPNGERTEKTRKRTESIHSALKAKFYIVYDWRQKERILP